MLRLRQEIRLFPRLHVHGAKHFAIRYTTGSRVTAMRILEMICGRKSAATLQVVWRNPKAVAFHRRRHTFEQQNKRAFYLLQEFVEDGRFGYWTTISDLEVVAGGRAA